MKLSVSTVCASLQIISGLVTAIGFQNTTNQFELKLAVFLDYQLVTEHLEQNLGLKSRPEIEEFTQVYVDQMSHILAKLGLTIKLVELRLEKRAGAFARGFLYSDIDHLLSRFCLHQANELDTAAIDRKWNVALLLTSKDLYSEHEAQIYSPEESRETLGISPVNGIQWSDLSCMIVEFGVGYRDRNLLDSQPNKTRVYPTRGFASAWTAAHELAHNLGIYHDGQPFNGDCDGSAYMMSPSSYLSSVPTDWSECSIKAFKTLDLGRFRKLNEQEQINTNSEDLPFQLRALPGQVYNLESQCKIFSQHLGAPEKVGASICNRSLECIYEITSTTRLAVPIGIALEGTDCSDDRSYMCIRGACVRKSIDSPDGEKVLQIQSIGKNSPVI